MGLINPTVQSIDYAYANRSHFVRELIEFIRFPTISTQPQHSNAMKRCASWLANHLQQIGLKHIKIIPTNGHPIVYGDWCHLPGYPTVLIYGHYDVLPPDPIEEWHSPPFTPAIQGNNLYGRGASDDKGQMFAHIKALESYLRMSGKLPVNVKCIFEGEEEIGSPSLLPFVKRYRNVLASDVAVLSDMPIPGPEHPAITYAMRGALSLELEVVGPKRDLHSGNFGGTVHNPLQALCEIIANLHDSKGQVKIPGFYDRVQQITAKERTYMACVGPTDRQILLDAQAEKGWGERGYTLYERSTIRPALAINGITGGYHGAGGKAVIPARAIAILSFRLVPDQEPYEINKLFCQYITQITPPAVKSTVRTSFGAKPIIANRRHPAILAAAKAYYKGFEALPVYLRCGGTIPVINIFQEILNIPTVMMGFGLPDDMIHAPNEKFYLPNFYNGIKTGIWFLAEMESYK